MAPLTLALFDCDGTMLDGQHTVLAAMCDAWAEHGLDRPDDDLVRGMIGLTLHDGIGRILPDGAEVDPHRVADSYKRAYRHHREQHGAVDPAYPGIAECLDRLEAEGVLLGVATGKSLRGLHSALDAHGWNNRFVTLQTPDHGPGKPHPDMVHRALGEAGVEPVHAIMIGDTSFDMEMAVAAGVGAIGVSWGYHATGSLHRAGAEAIVDDAETLTDLLLERLGPSK
ncbi:MAG: HAD-IA family hydrolase [Pseudomonadota bacterium]